MSLSLHFPFTRKHSKERKVHHDQANLIIAKCYLLVSYHNLKEAPNEIDYNLCNQTSLVLPHPSAHSQTKLKPDSLWHYIKYSSMPGLKKIKNINTQKSKPK